MALFRIGNDEVMPEVFFDRMADQAFIGGDEERESLFRDLSYRFSGRGDIMILKNGKDPEDDY